MAKASIAHAQRDATPPSTPPQQTEECDIALCVCFIAIIVK